MNRADKMLTVLQDGRVHSRRDIWERTGEFFLTNNAANELRRRGLNVQYDKKQDAYQLVPSLDETPADSSCATFPCVVPPSQSAGVSSSEERQLDPTDGPLLVLFDHAVAVDHPRLFAA